MAMQVVHEQVGLDNKKAKPLKVVDDGKEEKLEPFRLDKEIESPQDSDQQPSDQEEVAEEEEEIIEESNEEESEVKLQEDSVEEDNSDKRTKKKKKNYQGRINELVKRASEAERERNKLFSYNQELVSKLQTMKPDYQKTQQDLIESKKKNLEEGLKMARESHKAAYESGDSDKLLEVAEKIADIKYDMKSLDSEAIKKVTTSNSDVEKLTSNATNTSSSQVDPKALRWAQSNPWFGKDVAMTGAAYSIDAQLKTEGYDPSSEEYYAEVDRRVKESFPHKFDEEKPRQVVAGVRRGTKNTTNKVRLSESQLAMAQRLGVPPEEYAKFVGSN
tara:strand:- start:998 stop:1990 length:993 start_codon:yes stop_codon:yes gene_type:complete